MLRSATAQYASFFRLPDVVRMLAMALLSRMPIGMVTLSMLLHVRTLTDSFAAAGAAVGCYLGAAAATAPILGRFIDRRGPRSALFVTGVGCPVALCVLLLAKPLALGIGDIWIIAAIAGALSPPITVLTRTMWRHRFADESSRRMAFALDGVLVEFVFTAGPALVALLLAVGTPMLAFGVALCFVTLAVPIFVASPALRYWRHDPHADRHLLGPLTEPRLIALYVTTFLLTLALGLLEIGYPGFATKLAHPPLAGLLIAINSVGSAVGGLVYGGVSIALARESQLRRLLAFLAIPLASQALIGSAGALALVAFIAGLCIAPSLTVVSLLISSYAPSRYATEAFTWSTTCIVSGIGAGNAIGGALLERYDPAVVFAWSGAVALAAASCASMLRGAKAGTAK